MKERREYRRAYYLSHKEHELKRQKEYRRENADKIKAHNKSPARKQCQRKYQHKYQKHYIKRRRQTDVNFYLKDRLRSRLYYALKRNQKTGSAVKDLGCTIPELKKHMESKFQPGMTWDNRGKEWHIDHIIPLATFNLQDRRQFLVACHYTNLQPLWARDNMVKGMSVLGK
jgi:hypothetical protein